MNFLIWCMWVVLWCSDKTPIKRVGGCLEFTSITGTHAFHFKLKMHFAFFGNGDDSIHKISAWNIPVTHGDSNTFASINTIGYPGDIRDQGLLYIPLLINEPGKIGN